VGRLRGGRFGMATRFAFLSQRRPDVWPSSHDLVSQPNQPGRGPQSAKTRWECRNETARDTGPDELQCRRPVARSDDLYTGADIEMRRF
jgi:hypothetical protein